MRTWCIMVEGRSSGAQGCVVGRPDCVVLPLQKLAPKGVDVVYDPVGGKSFEEALKVVKWGAQILIIGFASGDIPKVTLAGALPGRCEGRFVPAEVRSYCFSELCCEHASGCGQGCSWTGQGLSSERAGCSCSVHHACLCMQVAANIALVKNLTFHGVFWGSYMQNNPPVLQRSLLELVAWLDQGRITVPVSHRCPLLPVGLLQRLCEGSATVFASKRWQLSFSSLPDLTRVKASLCLA